MSRILIAGALLFAGIARASDSSAAACANVSDVYGNIQHPLDAGNKAGSVLIFYWHDCPICNSYVPEVNRLRARYSRFAFYFVEVDPDYTASQARAHAKQFNLEAPLLLDPKHRLTDLARATITPEAVVFGANQAVVYRGRIDDTYAEPGVRRPAATTHDLRDALDAILAGKPVGRQPQAVGCWIPR